MNDDPLASPLLTDLYELTMAASYFDQGMETEATFSLFLRRQARRGYFVAAGLAPALEWLRQMAFKPDDIAILQNTGLFKADFLNFLSDMKFTGSVRALPEGTLFFAHEPILEVTAPLIQAQILETCLINIIGLHSMLATKAARCVHAARGRSLVDFSLRRTQGAHAGMAVARSAYLAGFDATSNVLAGGRYGIPTAGTMAHAYVQSFADEPAAFQAFAETFPHRSIFLIDTFDTLAGAHQAAAVARAMAAQGRSLVGVRLDSGDMVALSREVRRILDDAGLPEVKVFASGGYDEYRIADVLKRGAAVDAFGVGTKMGVSADMPYLDLVYKMVHYDRRNTRKYSPGKQTLGGAKQVFRRTDPEGYMTQDVIGVPEEEIRGARPLLVPVMVDGALTGPLPDLDDVRDRFQGQWTALPEPIKDLYYPEVFPVRLSRELILLQDRLDSGLQGQPRN